VKALGLTVPLSLHYQASLTPDIEATGSSGWSVKGDYKRRSYLSKKDLSKKRVPKLKRAAKEKRAPGRMATLKTSSWCEGAARSVGINKGRSLEKRDG
jgi:hypothetical protein